MKGLGQGKPLRWVILIAALALAMAACGTRVDKQAFYDALAEQQQTIITEGSAGSSPDGTTASGGSSSNGGSQVLGTRSTAPGSVDTDPPSGGGASGGSAAAIPSHVSRAVIGDTITVGFHVPITGAAPLPLAWTDTLAAVEEWLNKEARINGRGVRFVLEDDGYDPAKGLAACRKLADSNVLFVIGHTMPTVQERCSRFFNDRGIPYLIRGIPESTLQGAPLTWFGTASDDFQARALAQYVLKRMGGATKKVAIVTENDQPVSKEVFARTIRAGGGDVVAIENSVPRQPDFGPIISKLRQAGAEIVFLNIAPVDAIKIAVQSQGEGFHPTWVGEGTHWNYNLTLESAGKAMDGAVALSNWASIDSPAANGFKAVLKKYRPNAVPDDVGLVIWGWTNLVRTALLDTGKDLSRASFAAALNRLDFDQPYWHRVRFTPTDHRGARAVAVFRADGTAKRWRQIEGFSAGF